MTNFNILQQLKMLDRLLSEAEAISDTIDANLAAKLKKAA